MSSTLVRVALAGILATAAAAFAAAGDPDPSFGIGGTVVTTIGAFSEIESMARQADGKIVAAGEGGDLGDFDQFILARYDTAGALDPTFGTDGIVRTTPVPGVASRVWSVLAQADGKIVAVGTAAILWDQPGVIVLARYDAAGALDPTFGSGGIVVTDRPGVADRAAAAVLQPDGRIVVAGFTRNDLDATDQDVLIARYDAAGALDATFGIGGIVTFDFPGLVADARDMVLQPDGGIVVAGFMHAPASKPSQGFIVRVDDDGTPDAGFGVAGRAILASRPYVTPFEIALLPDGSFLTSGTESSDLVTFRGFIARVADDGTVDTSSGGDGLRPTVNGPIFAMATDSAGRVLAGGAEFLWGDFGAVGVSRYLADASPDPTFGLAGHAAVSFVTPHTNGGTFAVVPEPDGSAVTVGGFLATGPLDPGRGGEPRQFALARFVTAPTACTTDAQCPTCEHCDVSGVCANGPRTVCDHSPKPTTINYAGGPSPVVPAISWKWRLTPTPPDYDPTTTAHVGLCMWWGSVATVYESDVPPGAPWKRQMSGAFIYRDPARSVFGLQEIKLGRTLLVKAKGPNIRNNPNRWSDALLQPGDATVPLEVQVHAGGRCYAATYPQAVFKTRYPAHTRTGKGQ